jgi:YVTN family beta-propeller protein
MAMVRKPVLMVVWLMLLTAGCIPRPVVYRPALQNEGEALVYLQPLPQQTERLRFSLTAVFAVGEDGTRYPLEPSFTQISGSAFIGRQKRMAWAVLPPGVYSAIALQIGEALLLGENGESPLLVPDAPVSAKLRFEIVRKEALALFLTLTSTGLSADGAVFKPDFALSAAGRELTSLTGMVSHPEANLISIFNKKSMQVVGAVATAQGPAGVVIDRRSRRAYVACREDDLIEEIDLLEGRVVGDVRLRLGDGPLDLALTPDGRTLVSANFGSNSASIIDTASRVEIARLAVGQKPLAVETSPDGAWAYVLNAFSNTLSILDLGQHVVAATLSVDSRPVQGAFDRRGDRFLVVSRDSPDLTVFDTRSLQVLDRIYVGAGAAAIVVDPQTNLAYVAKRFSDEVAVVDPAVLMFIDSVKIGAPAARMSIDDEENSLFLVQPDNQQLLKINLTSKRIVSELDVGEAPYAVALANQR